MFSTALLTLSISLRPLMLGSSPATFIHTPPSEFALLQIALYWWGNISNHWITGRKLLEQHKRFWRLCELYPHPPPLPPGTTEILPSCTLWDFRGWWRCVLQKFSNLMCPMFMTCLLLPGYIFSGLGEILNKDSYFYFRKFCASL